MTAHSGGIPGYWNACVAPKAKRIQRRERTLPDIDLDRDLAGSDLRTIIYEIAEAAGTLAGE